MGDLSDGSDVRHTHGGVVRRFDVYQPCAGRNRLADRIQVGHINHDGLHAELVVEQLVEHTVDRHIADLWVYHTVTGFKKRPEQRMQRPNAAGQHDGVVRIVECRDLLLQPVLVGVAVAGVHQKIGGGIIDPGKVVRQFVAVGHVQRAAHRAGFRIVIRAGMYGLGGDTVVSEFVFFSRHDGISSYILSFGLYAF